MWFHNKFLLGGKTLDIFSFFLRESILHVAKIPFVSYKNHQNLFSSILISTIEKIKNKRKTEYNSVHIFHFVIFVFIFEKAC